MPDLITMDGQYAYTRDPYTQVRILCVDRPGVWPVVSMDAAGEVRTHQADGRTAFSGSGHHLVPLQHRRKPVEAWALVGPNGGTIAFSGTKDGAGRHMYEFPGSRLIRLIEAEDAL